MIKFNNRAMLAVLGAVLVAGAAPVSAQPTTLSLGCASTKQKDLGKHAAAVLNCYSGAAKRGGTLTGDIVTDACVDKAEVKYLGAHAKAELKTGCATEAQTLWVGGGFCLNVSGSCVALVCTSGRTGSACAVDADCRVCEKGLVGKDCTANNALDPVCSDWDDTGATADDADEATALASLVRSGIAPALVVAEGLGRFDSNGAADFAGAALYPAPAINGCAAAKLKEAGKAASGLLGCHSKAAKTGTPVVDSCLQKVRDKFTAAFAKAELKPPCLTTGDAAPVLADIEAFVELGVLYTPRGDGCGSGFTQSPETCDDSNIANADNCPSDCIVDTCSPISGSDRPFQVSFNSTKSVSGIRYFIDYPESKVSILGSGGSVPLSEYSTDQVGAFTALNDYDHGIRMVVTAGIAAFGLSGPLNTIHFEDCTGAVAPIASELTCTVIDASDAAGKAVSGVTCSVS